MKIFDKEIDFEIVKDSFKEDSVREEIIFPILKKLGYSAFDSNKIIRSKNLTHPYIQFGTKKEHISIIPDYIMQVNDKNVFILDAKAPSENLLKGKNPEQAFSYAIHREIRVDKYALCNGIEFVVFNVNELEPLLYIKVENIEEKWDEVYRLLSPLAFEKPYIFNYKPDFGLRYFKSGMNPDATLHFLGSWITYAGRIDEDNFTFSSAIPFSGDCLGSFDFDKSQFEDFISQVPPNIKEKIKSSLTRYPFNYYAGSLEESFEVYFSAKLSGEVYNNDDEVYLPFRVLDFNFRVDDNVDGEQ